LAAILSRHHHRGFHPAGPAHSSSLAGGGSGLDCKLGQKSPGYIGDVCRLSAWRGVFGYFLGFGLFISIQTILLQLFMIYVLNIYTIGNFSTILIVNLLLAFGSLALGTLLSSFAKNEFQLFQFIPAIIVPQILFSGVFDISNSPKWVEILSKLFPMTYGAEALKNVALKGYNLGDIQFDIFVLLFYAVLFLVLNILTLKKYRRI